MRRRQLKAHLQAFDGVQQNGCLATPQSSPNLRLPGASASRSLCPTRNTVTARESSVESHVAHVVGHGRGYAGVRL